MIKAEFVYEVLLTYDIDTAHTTEVRKLLIEKYGFHEIIKVSTDGKSLIDYKLPASSLYHPHSSTDSVAEVFKNVCTNLGVLSLSCIATKCGEGRAIVIDK